MIELLVVLAILALLVGLFVPSLLRARASAQATYCMNQMRQLGTAVMLYADDHFDMFPRSQHSAFAHRDLPWARALAPYLAGDADWRTLIDTAYRCPSDRRRGQLLSYGLNVYFELGPGDDYEGYPSTWRKRVSVPQPAATILFAENNSEADHIMPNFWGRPEDAVDVAHDRHQGQANYLFVDGHVEQRPLAGVYRPRDGIDAWNPGQAGSPP